MRPKLSIVFLVVVGLIGLFIVLRAQSGIADYGKLQTDAARSFELAQILVNGNWNKEQQEFLIRGVYNPESIKYSADEAQKLFGQDVRQLYSVGKRNVTNFRIIWNLESRADKVKTFDALSRVEKADVRSKNFAYRIATERYLPEQISFILEVNAALATATEKELREFERRSIMYFTPQQQSDLFGSIIGPYVSKPCTKDATGNFQGDCPCNIGSSFNESCYSECADSGGSCHTTESGCGFVGFFACNGGCQTKPGGDLKTTAVPRKQ